MKKYQVGIIGTGFGADVHAPIFKLHPGFDVKAIASVYRGKSSKLLREIELNNIYLNWNEMLEKENLDLIVVASTPYHHYDMTLSSIQKGHHVLCEKPMGMNTSQTLIMFEEQRKSKVLGFINFQWRMTPVRKKIKELLNKKELGEIQYIKYQGSFSGYDNLSSHYRGWEGRRELGGGLLYSVGSHMIDALMWWMEQQITDVYADLRTFIPSFCGIHGTEKRDAEDAFTITGHFHDGTPFTVDLFTSAFRGDGWKLEIFGTKGTLIMKNDKEVLLSFGGEFQSVSIEEIAVPSQLSSPANQYYTGLYPMIDFIYKAIRNKQIHKDLPTFSDGHQVQLVMDAINESAKNKAMTRVQST